jgi:predicted MFS family arabinose efflux permease
MRSRGWTVVFAYGLVAAATQALWLTYAPITTETAHHYHVSVSAVGWLSEIFPLLYVLLAIPAGALLDRWFRPVLAAGGMLVAGGGLLRLGGEGFAWAMAGQVVVSVAQPVVMSAVSKLAGEYLPKQERAAGIAAASASGFLGMLIALLLGPALGAAHLQLLLTTEAVAATLCALLLAAALMLRRGLGEGEAVEERVAVERGVALRLWGQPSIKILCGLSFLGFGVFVALSTWLQALLHPSHVSETDAGVLLVVMILAGVIGCAVLPPAIERRHAERAFMRTVVLVGCLGSVALALLPGVAARAVVMVAIGVAMLPALPVVLTLAERLAGAAAGTAGAIIWLAGNLGGLVVALIVQALVHEPLAAFVALAVVVTFGLPLAGRAGEVAERAAELGDFGGVATAGAGVDGGPSAPAVAGSGSLTSEPTVGRTSA